MRPGLDQLVIKDRVAESLATAGVHRETLEGLCLDRAWPAGKKGLTALYRDQRGTSPADSWAVLSCSAEAHLPKVLRRAARQGSGVALAELQAFAFPFAHDPRLTQLERLMRPEAAASELGHWLPDRIKSIQPRVLRYKPLRRCVIEVQIATESHSTSLFCKVQRPSNDITTRQNHLATQGYPTANHRVRFAHPVGSIDDWNMLVWFPASGKPLDDLHAPEADATLSQIAGGLAELHRSSVTFPQQYSRRDELETLAKWVHAASSAYPDLASDLLDAHKRIERLADGMPTAKLVPSHRDFHPGQVLIDQHHVVLMDLDTAAMAEPELDVGNFLAHLAHVARDAAALGHPGRAVEIFRSAYAWESGGRLRSDRLTWYQASSLLRLACVHSFRPGGWHKATGFIVSALESIGDVARSSPQVHYAASGRRIT